MPRFLCRYEQVDVTTPEGEVLPGFRPEGVSPLVDWSSWDLRPFGVDGCVVSSESKPTGSLNLDDRLDKLLPNPIRDRIGYDTLADLIVDRVYTRLRADRMDGVEAHRIRFTGFTLFEQPPILAAAFGDETWGTGTGTAWTIAQGADNDWTRTDERSTTALDIVSGEGRAGSFSQFLSRFHALINGVSQQDGEAEVTVRYTGTLDESESAGVIFRRTASNTYYVFALYTEGDEGLNLVRGNGTVNVEGVGIGKLVAGTYTHLGNAAAAGFASATDYQLKARTEGTALKVRSWLSSGSEPGSWDIEVTDTSITAAGGFGVAGSGKDTKTLLFESLVTDDLASAFDPPNLAASVTGDDVTLTWDASP